MCGCVDVRVCAGGCVDVCVQVDVRISSNKLSIGFSLLLGYSNEFKYIHLHLCCTTLASNLANLDTHQYTHTEARLSYI